MKTETIAMVLVGGKGSRLRPITERKAKPAVTFAGKYRLVDFVLSNLANTMINTVGIITQYEPHSLMDYIGLGSSWDLDVAEGGVHFLTPYTDIDGEKWQKGTAHAIRQHLHFVRTHDPAYVLVLSGDHIYKMDYRDLIKTHEKKGADFTIGIFTPHDSLSRYGVLTLDKEGFVEGFEEKPDEPRGDYASMGIYLFNRDTLEKILANGLEEGFDFGRDIIPKAIAEKYTIGAHEFQGYFRDVGTIESLYEANMDLIDHPERLMLNDYKNLPVFTRSSNLSPHHVIKKHGIADALISDGCMIEGKIRRSVLSGSVIVKSGASVEGSLLFAGVVVGEGAKVKNAIVLEETVILPDTELVFETPTVIDNERLWDLGGGRRA